MLKKLFQGSRAFVRLLLVFLVILAVCFRAVWARLLGRHDVHQTAELGIWASRWMVTLTGIELRVHGELPESGAILVANHRSYTDIPAILYSLPCAFLAKASVGRWPVIGWAARLANTVFVERASKESRRAARASLKALQSQGLSVVIFPEGTTSPSPGRLPFRPGMFHLAAEGGLRVVPVAIEYKNSEDAWLGDDSFVPHFLRRFGEQKKSVVVTFGPVLMDTNGELLLRKVDEWLDDELAKGFEARFTHGVLPLVQKEVAMQASCEVSEY